MHQRVLQRTGGDLVVEQAGRLQEADEERHLAEWRDRGLWVPVYLDLTGTIVDRHWPITRDLSQRLLTFRVQPEDLGGFRHDQEFAGDSPDPATSTAGFRITQHDWSV